MTRLPHFERAPCGGYEGLFPTITTMKSPVPALGSSALRLGNPTFSSAADRRSMLLAPAFVYPFDILRYKPDITLPAIGPTRLVINTVAPGARRTHPTFCNTASICSINAIGSSPEPTDRPYCCPAVPCNAASICAAAVSERTRGALRRASSSWASATRWFASAVSAVVWQSRHWRR